MINIKRAVSRIIHELWALVLPVTYAKYVFKKIKHRKLNLRNPRDYNEKIQWLKLYSDISPWTYCADKYKVRQYVEDCGYGHILCKIYGVWKNAAEINFSELPEKFVLKTNHAFGTVIIVKDKETLDVDLTKKQLNKWLKSKYGLLTFEPHYWKIQRRIIAEEFLNDSYNQSLSSSLIDYKFWCIHGEPVIIVAMINRENLEVGSPENLNLPQFQDSAYDLQWNFLPDVLTSSKHSTVKPLPKPNCLNQMIEICRALSKPFVTVRIDLYEVKNKVYFGEFTFTPGGKMAYFSEEYFLKMGEKIDLSNVRRRKRIYPF